MKKPLHIKYEYQGITYTVKRSYLRLASVYRRFCGRNEQLDFSEQALLDCYLHESRGLAIKKYYGTESHKNNGYVIGKWAKDISVTTWKEDITNGYLCKAEFITPLTRWWVDDALIGVISAIWFPFGKEYRQENINKFSK